MHMAKSTTFSSSTLNEDPRNYTRPYNVVVMGATLLLGIMLGTEVIPAILGSNHREMASKSYMIPAPISSINSSSNVAERTVSEASESDSSSNSNVNLRRSLLETTPSSTTSTVDNLSDAQARFIENQKLFSSQSIPTATLPILCTLPKSQIVAA